MKISQSTLDVLENFSNINESILIKPGNRLISFSNQGTILANAKIDDEFTERFGIYDLNSFLSLTSLVEDADIDTSLVSTNKYAVISGAGARFKFYVADESLIKVAPKEEIELPSVDLEFVLEDNHMKRVLKAASVLTLDTITLYSDNGGLYFGVSDPKQKNSDSFSVRIADYEGPELFIVVSIQMLRFMPGDYNVSISHGSSNIALQFSHSVADLRYWIAAESDSYVK